MPSCMRASLYARQRGASRLEQRRCPAAGLRRDAIPCGGARVTRAATRSRSTRPTERSSASRRGCASAASSPREGRSSSPTSISATASPRRSAAAGRPPRRSRARCRSPPAPSGARSMLSIMTTDAIGRRLSVRALAADLERRATTRDAVERVRDAIARGDVYQVNLVQHLAAEFAGDPGALAARLARPAAHTIESPIAATAGRSSPAHPSSSSRGAAAACGRARSRGRGRPGPGQRASSRGSAKDAAEHVMIVDLERNDLSRVCEPGSVRWPELMATRALAGVEHMVSTVEGTLRDGVGLAELLAATFPGGSITGAPKIAAVDLIAELEPVGRGASMGALGRVYGNGDLDLALTIRTFAIAEGRIHLWVGGGVVWDSDPAGRDRRVVGQGRSAAARDRGAARRQPATRRLRRRQRRCGGRAVGAAMSGDALPRRRRLGARPRRARRAGARRRRRGVHARPRRVRDDARLRRAPVPVRASTSPASRSSAERIGLEPPDARRDRARSPRSRSSRRARPRRSCGSTGRRGRRAASTARSRSSARSRTGSRRPARAASGSSRCSTSGARRRGCSRRRSRRATPSASRPRPRRRLAARTTPSSSTPTGSCSRAR